MLIPHNFFYYSFLVRLENVEIRMKNSCKISKDFVLKASHVLNESKFKFGKSQRKKEKKKISMKLPLTKLHQFPSH
jgi:hypothetical protein